MIDVDGRVAFDPDCSTCAHRAERHPSRREQPSRPRSCQYVCMVCARQIREHGTLMRHTDLETPWPHEVEWVWDVPCKAFDNERGEWVALDWEARDG